MTEDRLYHEQLLMLARQVREQPLLENPTHTAEMTNPTCGDKVTVMLALVDDHVKEISVHVRGCAICEASAGILLDMVKHQPEPALPVAMLDHMSDDIKQWFISPSDAAAPFSSLSAMTPIKTSYRNRQRCATLAFEAASLAAKTPNVLFKGN